MPVILFNERFAEKVRLGEKRQTIRKTRKRPIKPGDKLILRRWSGKPYRSKQVLIMEAVCESVTVIEIFDHGVYLEDWTPFGGYMDESLAVDDLKFEVFEASSVEALAKADGFETASEMFDWFEKTHGREFFEGVLIRWRTKDVSNT